MLARHPGLPVSAVVLLSPIVSPGQLSYPPGPDGASASEDALDELNHLVGGMSPYGPSGAQNLLSSVSEFGARYFDDVVTAAGGGADGKSIRWLAVVPLADAVTLPECELPPGVIVVPAFHGGLLGDPAVLPMVSSFLSGHAVTARRRRSAARGRRADHRRGRRLAHARHQLGLPVPRPDNSKKPRTAGAGTPPAAGSACVAGGAGARVGPDENVR